MICERCGKRYKKEENNINRCKNVCNECFRVLDMDNKLRHKKGIEIPNSFDLIIDKIKVKFSRNKRWRKRG